MNKKRILSALLCVVMLASAMCLPAFANGLTIVGKAKTTDGLTIVQNYGDTAIPLSDDDDEEQTPVPTEPGNPKNSGMVLNKTAKAVSGGYEITLEAYATGSKVTTSVNKDVPTDIVLVIDQSGSMAFSMGNLAYAAYDNSTTQYSKKNSNLYNYRHNKDRGEGNLWYQLGDESYVSVSVDRTVKESSYTYSRANVNSNQQVYNSANNNNYNRTQYYIKCSDGETYAEVTIKRTQTGNSPPTYTYTYTYTDSDGIEKTKTGTDGYNGSVPELYTRDRSYNTDYDYTYYYTTEDGNTVTLGTSSGNNSDFNTVTLYRQYTEEDDIRLDALKEAVTQFARSVNEKAKGEDGEYGTDDDIAHRVAVVGFASGGYNNTELLTGVTITTGEYNYGTDPDTWNNRYYPTGYTKDGVQYGSITDEQYGNALQNMNSATGYANVLTAFDALTAYGGTRTNDGIDMANKIFENNSIPEGEKRNRVVIVFTDGLPTGSGSSYNSEIANDAITKAGTAKNTYGATVYAIGVFSGADATKAGSTGNGSTDADKGNYFCQQISSNNGTPQSPSYYLSAADADSLNNIFQQISNNIESGGSSTTLDSSTVIKDIISPQFQLPEGATASDITIETYACTGKTGDEFDWKKNNDNKGAKATVSGGNVDVSGFDFSENWVGTETTNGSTTYRGNKLVIKFTVQTKEGFLGGNDVYTNTSAGVYKNSSDDEPVLTFPKPTVNVPIDEVNVEAEDKNVYLLGELTEEQIKAGATATCGNVTLDLSKADNNYGLQDWQTAYVNINVTYIDASSEEITDLNDLIDDTTYTVKVTVAPKTTNPKSTEGTTATTKTASDEGKINVFKPELTYKDSDVYYGDTAPTDYTGNLNSTVWKHGETLSNGTGVTMIGEAPTLDFTYTPESGKIVDNKIATKQDIAVGVTVKIGDNDVTEKTTFEHTNCTGKTCGTSENGKFWLHVKTCSLTIEKKAGTGTTIGDDEYFVFNVKKDGSDYTQVIIKGTDSVTISELPVGNYTVEEDKSTAWRYDTRTISGGVTLSSTTTSGTITCTNSNKDNHWLNFFTAVKNIFGEKSGKDH